MTDDQQLAAAVARVDIDQRSLEDFLAAIARLRDMRGLRCRLDPTPFIRLLPKRPLNGGKG